MFVTEIGRSYIVDLGIDVRSIEDYMIPHSAKFLSDPTVLTAFNIHVLVRKTENKAFCCGAEIATAHSPIDPRVKGNYADGVEQGYVISASQRNLANLTDAIVGLDKRLQATEGRLVEKERQLGLMQDSTFWKLTAPLRAVIEAARKAAN